MLVFWIAILVVTIACVMVSAGGLGGGIMLVFWLSILALTLGCLIYLGGVFDQNN
jgi:hypothetical protein